MSHFAVAVFHREDQNIEELLAPYNENLEVEPYVRYTRDEAIAWVKENYRCESKTDDECWQMLADDYEKTDNEGNIYSTYNPKSKWDWYQVGGRFSDMLMTNDGCRNSARVGDVDFSPDPIAYEEALRFWDVAIDHQPAKEGEKYTLWYTEQYYRDYYGDRETYARDCSQFITYAVVTPDEEWHEKGEMGWWGMSSETPNEAKDWNEHYRERFIDAADPDWYITIVDCHI